MRNLFSVVGSNNVTPLAMAGAYATVAYNGIYCQPKAIDRVTDSDGVDLPIPTTTCTQVLDPKVAATAAFVLQGVMNGGGTGAVSNPWDGTPRDRQDRHQRGRPDLDGRVLHEGRHRGVGRQLRRRTTSFSKQWANGIQLNQMRHKIAPVIQRAADAAYGGDAFPQPDIDLTTTVLADLPSVIGKSVDEATSTCTRPASTSSSATRSTPPTPSRNRRGAEPRRRAGPRRHHRHDQPQQRAGHRGARMSAASRSTRRSATSRYDFGNVQPGTCTEDKPPRAAGQGDGHQPARAGTVVNRNYGRSR